MSAQYPLYPERRSLVLDGFWDFAWLGDVNIAAVTPEAHAEAFNEIAAVPGCYNLAGPRIDARGAALYRTRFVFPSGPTRLKFGGLGLYARIWLDNIDLGEIKTPYSTVSRDVSLSETDRDEHELLVLVDNRFGNPDTVPIFKPYADFYGYGGIYRSVTLTRLPDTRVERVKVTTLDIATGQVRLEARFGGRIPDRLRIRYAFDDGTPVETTLAPVGKQGLMIETQVPGHRVWSPENPNLHTLSFGISCPDTDADAPFEESDTVIERFGIRTIATRGRDILLNGSPVRLLGLNRHESHPQFGPVQPPQLIADDLQWARELNANFIRAVHYQPDPNFLDACDRAGFLVWAETLGWAQPQSDACDASINALHRDAALALVDTSLNHPSVIIYAFLNESCSDTPDGRRLYQNLVQTLRDADSSRLISYASNRFEKDLCFDLADIISINPYPGWIGGRAPVDEADKIKIWATPSLSRIRPEFDRLAEYFSTHPQYAQKPLLVSESGACGIYGIRDRARSQWSEEFQQDYFDEAIRAVLDNPRYLGTTLWQMIDCRSFANVGPEIRTKPRGYNNAGLLDEYRRPKLAFDTVKSLYERYCGKGSHL
ncbi:glycoside hydrolase family 2 protein [Geminisphaera colitermitum]|uniref:glycoside hydrolase family 2 protein n=1 Tax=Geminisphaera colitermitum TaxID=1148786 RepID=UPI000158C75A|nr:glycoside hydrolase family 2 TIM barrel-domain containing protein [Geminisphaera colitermitum]